jgi:RNA polymerase sigma-70 factor (ECF subfamily)
MAIARVNPHDTPASDADVIASSIRVPEEFRAIFDRHAADVHHFVARRAGRQAADDVLSDVFVIAFDRRGRFDPASASALPWLYGIALNAMRRGWRTAATQHRIADRAAHEVVDMRTSHEEHTVDRIDAANRWNALRPVLDELAHGDRQALLLYAWEELSYAQIAVVLEVPVGTVRSRIHRARAHVRARIDQLTVKELHHD